jgi:hypothetical protein
MRRRPRRQFGRLSIGKSLVLVFAGVLAIFCAAALSSARPQSQSAVDKEQLERGRYLVQQVGVRLQRW